MFALNGKPFDIDPHHQVIQDLNHGGTASGCSQVATQVAQITLLSGVTLRSPKAIVYPDSDTCWNSSRRATATSTCSVERGHSYHPPFGRMCEFLRKAFDKRFFKHYVKDPSIRSPMV